MLLNIILLLANKVLRRIVNPHIGAIKRLIQDFNLLQIN